MRNDYIGIGIGISRLNIVLRRKLENQLQCVLPNNEIKFLRLDCN